MASGKVARRAAVGEIADLLDSPEVAALILELDALRGMNVPIICLRKGRPIPLSPIPHGSDEWKRLYRGRGAVEREFGRLKHDYGLAPLRVRGLERVQLHADLVILARLTLALSRARAMPLAA